MIPKYDFSIFWGKEIFGANSFFPAVVAVIAKRQRQLCPKCHGGENTNMGGNENAPHNARR